MLVPVPEHKVLVCAVTVLSPAGVHAEPTVMVYAELMARLACTSMALNWMRFAEELFRSVPVVALVVCEVFWPLILFWSLIPESRNGPPDISMSMEPLGPVLFLVSMSYMKMSPAAMV